MEVSIEGSQERRGREDREDKIDSKDMMDKCGREDREDNLPASNSDYSSPAYWDSRYSREPHYEWLLDYRALAPALAPLLARLGTEARILQLGCGNSGLALDLHTAGYTDVTNIDISGVCVANMKVQHPELTFLEMDMASMAFPDASFDLVVEKATVDSVLVDTSPWELTSPGHLLATRTLREVKRVLRPQGTFLSITFAQPHHRVPLLTQPGLSWSVVVDKVSGEGSLLDYYVMVMEEGGEAGRQAALARWGLGEGPSLGWREDAVVSEDEETFIEGLQSCIFQSDVSSGEEEGTEGSQ